MHFRCFNLLIIQFNVCFQEIFMSFLTASLGIAIVVLNYVLIRADLPILVFGYVMVIDIILSGVYILVYNRGAFLVEVMKSVLILRKSMAQTKFCQRDLQGIQEVTIGIGSMHYLDEETRLIAFTAIQDYTLNLLITF